MTPTFNAADASTWPSVMAIDEVAALYRRSVGAVRQACESSKFQPVPFLKRPFRWRKVDVLRHLEGARTPAQLQRVI